MPIQVTYGTPKPTYKFEFDTDYGINEVPDNSIIHITDPGGAFGSDPILVHKISNGSLIGNSSINDFLNDTSLWKPLSGGGGGDSELEKITENSKTGWRLLGENPTNHLQIGSHAIDLTTPYFDGETYSNSGASGNNSYAEGHGAIASGDYSHAEGYKTTASGNYGSHAEGFSTIASGNYGSHAEGFGTTASGDYSHSEGYYTIAQNSYQHSAGKYNTGTATDTIHETGIGTDSSNKKNAFEIYTDGRIHAPEQTIALHDDPRSLATKEYVDAGIDGGLASQRFTDLADTPGSLVGAGNKWLRVNDTETALEYIDGPTVVINNLNDLLDVTVNSPQNNQTLVYNDTTFQWENGNQNIDNIGGFSVFGAQDGQILIYNASTSQWENSNTVNGGTF